MTAVETYTNGNAAEGTPPHSEVCVVGAGPAGLMLASNLVRFGIQTTLVDERPDQTSVGRADGLQPKTLETLQMMRLGDRLLRVGTKVYDICMWSSGGTDGTKKTLQRTGREEHYPLEAVDVVEPYILLCHQGMVEELFVDDLLQRGVEVVRSTQFRACSRDGNDVTGPLLVHCTDTGKEGRDVTFATDFLVGCDGAHSKVRSAIPGASATANGSGSGTTAHYSVWGVLDGVVETDFPDIWSKTVVHSASLGSVLIIPRERGLTRFYVEIKASATARELDQLGADQGEEYVKQRARSILQPYHLSWKSVEWFGRYQVAQRVANAFADAQHRVFIGGDASHAHSPKAAQGMNTSMHDAWNLAWKLNLAVRGLAQPGVLLATYEAERKKIAHDLIAFDYEHANHIAGGDAQALAANFLKNVRFIAGVGVEYAPSVLNLSQTLASPTGGALPGCNLPPAKVTRYIDANRVDIQLDMPALGQFRVYLFVPDVVAATASGFLSALYDTVGQPSSLMSRLTTAAAASYEHKPRSHARDDAYICPERYTAVSHLFSFALVTQAAKKTFEIAQLPPVLAASPWTVYLDDVAHLDTRGLSCTEKWLGSLQTGEAAIVNVRPDGYVGSVHRWGAAGAAEGREAAAWLDSYYGGFLQVPE